MDWIFRNLDFYSGKIPLENGSRIDFYDDFSQNKTESSTCQWRHRNDQHCETQVVKFCENPKSGVFGI